MLRVRPIHFTSHLDEWEQLLTDLGMIRTVDDGPWKEFDSGSGRLALHAAEAGSTEDGTTAFGVEVGDLAEFARRTNEAGVESGTSPAELTRADHGDTCRITGEDGFSFLADKAAHGAQCADADPALAVVEVWFTPDAAAAAQTLRNMGARHRPVPDDDETADFTAKNGGVLLVRPGSGNARAGLGFEYTGDLSAVLDRLAAGGHQVRMTEEAFGQTLHVANPDAAGTTLWISRRLPEA
jgi:hypothetical protein